MTASQKESWGLPGQPIPHIQYPRYELQHGQQSPPDYESENSPYTSEQEDETLCCCPSLSEVITSCSKCCFCFCCCRRNDEKSEKFSKVNYSYLPTERSTDGIYAVEHRHTKPYKEVFKFPRETQQFPTHPSLPSLKPTQMKLQQPQLKFTPGGETGKVVVSQSDSPFPAPYLVGHGPGMQTPFSEVPIQRQPRAGDYRLGNTPLATTARAQRKKRSSRQQQGQSSRQDSLTKQSTTVTDVDVTTTSTSTEMTETKSESCRVTFEKDEDVDHDDEGKLKLRKSRGRQMSLPMPGHFERGRKRIFSIATKRMPQIGGYEGVDGGDLAENSEGDRRKQRPMHRARTVGSSPSQQPAVDPEKLRRCQTPEFADGGSNPKSGDKKKGLALRKCKTPDTIMMRESMKKHSMGTATKRQSESPETEEGSSTATSSPSQGSVKSAGKGGGGEESAGVEKEAGEGERVMEQVAPVHLPVVGQISSDGSQRQKRGSWREKSKKKPAASRGEGSRKSELPAHITASTSSYLLSSSSAAAAAAAMATQKVSDAGGGSGGDAQKNTPFIYFSLYFDIQRRALSVNLIKVENLPPKPPNQGPCDPFVMMFLLPNKQEVLQSVIKHGTLNPEFQQVFEFGGILANDLKNQVLVFRIFDHDKFSKNDLIGTVIMPLKDADLYGVHMRRPVDQRKGLLKQFSAGDLLFSLTYSEERHVLNGIILKATNLRKADIWGLADPYVKVYMIYDGKRVSKWKTEVKKNTLVPIYNESFQFDVSGLDIRYVSLEIWIMDYDWFSRNDKMGVVYVGANSPQEVGRNHWMEVISAPDHQTSHWHTIIPYTDLKVVLPMAKHHQQQQQQKLQVEQQQRLHLEQHHQPPVQYLRLPPPQHQQQLQQAAALSSNTTRQEEVQEVPPPRGFKVHTLK